MARACPVISKFRLLKESLSFPELTYQLWCQNLGSTVPLADGNKRRPWTRGVVDKDMKAARDTLTPMTIGTLAVNPPTTELACLLLQLKAIRTLLGPGTHEIRCLAFTHLNET